MSAFVPEGSRVWLQLSANAALLVERGVLGFMRVLSSPALQ
jgi:hypothetical protein